MFKITVMLALFIACSMALPADLNELITGDDSESFDELREEIFYKILSNPNLKSEAFELAQAVNNQLMSGGEKFKDQIADALSGVVDGKNLKQVLLNILKEHKN